MIKNAIVEGKEFKIGGSGIKVAEIEGVVYTVENCVDVVLENKKIDFFKGVKVDLFMNNEFRTSYVFKMLAVVDTEIGSCFPQALVFKQDIEHYSEAGNMYWAEGNGVYGLQMYYSPAIEEYRFVVTFDYALFAETFDGSEKFIAKVYYHNADETTPDYSYEY